MKKFFERTANPLILFLRMTKKKQLWILISIVLLAIIFFCVTFLVKNQSRWFCTPTKTETTLVDTSHWLVYENKEFGYRFKYPKNLKVLSGGDPALGFMEPRKGAVYILLPAKYPNIRTLDASDPSTFLDVKIGLSPIEAPSLYGETIDEMIKKSMGHTGVIKTTTRNGKTIVVYDEGERAYFIDGRIIYSFHLEGFNPNYKATRDWLKSINNAELTRSAENYPTYLKILEGIYTTFELL